MSENITIRATTVAVHRVKQAPIPMAFISRLRQPRRLVRAAGATSKAILRRLRYTVSPSDLTAAFRRHGIRNGDTIMVHSAFAGMCHFKGSPADAIDAMIEAVEPGGTVVMPAFSFDGTSLDYLRTRPTFNVRTAPARTGLLCEVFRRRSDTVRSLHPTHSVVAWGSRAAEITADHARSHTPFDKHSPWHRMYELDTWDVNLGLPLERVAVTHCHYFEEQLESQLGVPLYWPQVFDCEVIDAEGNRRRMPGRAHHPDSRAVRNYPRLYQRYMDAGVLHHHRVGAIDLYMGRVRSLFETTAELFAQGIPAFHEPAVDRTPRTETTVAPAPRR